MKDSEHITVMQPPSSSDDAESVAKKRGPLFRISYAVDRTMRAFFFRVGYLVSAHPLKTIALALLLTAIALIGMLRFQTESRAEELWVPQGTVALSNREYVVSNYGQSVRLARIAFVARDGKGLANKNAFLEMLDVAEAGWNVEVDPIDQQRSSNTVINWPERCLNSSDSVGNPVCTFSSAFTLFYDVDNVVNNSDGTVNFFDTVRRKLSRMNDAQIKNVLSSPPPTNDLRATFIAEEILGGASGSGDTYDFNIMLFTQFIDNNQIEKDGNREDVEAQEIEEKWTNFLLEDTPLLKGRSLDWYVESFWSQDDSLEQALNGDLPLLSFGFVLLTIYVVLFLGDFHVVRSHMWLAIGALLTTGLALGTCFGLSSAFGMFFGPVHQILPLLIVGIGIDDCFHVTRALDDINLHADHSSKSLRVRIALALSSSGSAITVTSFTNVVVLSFC
ncbi:Patched domain-containing protein 3 [Gracilariopsis chorda]|uniref:Patched domain-containing protein 3 n=1 Tax=Gracilariopsis chorda TaxID=448386 RepID=A0A2V3ILZ4_9FLOR|nr:Patched domain-containing protein 3 [Gracilariopsis chorda]|eukprot:PXF43067.1 Patched domain-containing protein 3 [Gracilariopsis chorda]